MARNGRSAARNARRVFGDTSYFYGLADAADAAHARAVDLSLELLDRGLEVVTTWEVVMESVTLLRYRLSFRAAARFLAAMESAYTVFYPSEADRLQAIRTFLKRSRGRKLSLCDALSHTVVSTHLDWAPCLSFDADFAALGLTLFR
jgi:predicted nucleic acid-binding protein